MAEWAAVAGFSSPFKFANSSGLLVSSCDQSKAMQTRPGMVREITIQVHQPRLASLKFAQSLIGKDSELILRSGKRFGPAPLRLEFCEKK